MDDATDVLFYPQDIFNYCHCTTAAGLRWRGGGTLPSTQRPVVNPVTEPIESGATVVDPARGGFAEQPVYPATQPQPDKSATSSGKTYVQHKHRLAVFTFTSSSKAVICQA